MCKHLETSHAETLSILEVSFLQAGYSYVLLLESFCKRDFLIIYSFCIPLQDVDESWLCSFFPQSHLPSFLAPW